jgi:hypothetical protein
LYELGNVQYRVCQASGITSDIEVSLNLLDEVHLELLAQAHDMVDAIAAVKNIEQLCDGLLAVRPELAVATEVAERWSIAQQKLVDSQPQTSQAEAVITHMVESNRRLAGEARSTAYATRNLDRMITVSRRLADESQSLPAAQAALAEIVNLSAAVDQASTIIDQIQRLMVDICLTQPEKVSAVLAPAVSATAPVAQPSPEKAPASADHALRQAWNYASGWLAPR